MSDSDLQRQKEIEHLYKVRYEFRSFPKTKHLFEIVGSFATLSLGLLTAAVINQINPELSQYLAGACCTSTALAFLGLVAIEQHRYHRINKELDEKAKSTGN